jgi:Bacterial pre-peptidase C-terminal domain
MTFNPSPATTTDLTNATVLLPSPTAPGLTDTTQSFSSRSRTAVSLGTAINNGAIAGRRVITNDVGDGDLWDVQQFQITTTSDVTLNLSGLQADADLYLVRDFNGNGLWDSDSELIAASINVGTLPDSLSVTGLGPGTYYALVATYDGFFTNYTLSTTTDAAGSTLSTARDLGTLNGNLTLNDFVGNSDPFDVYTFQTTAPGDFRLSLTGLTADADVRLIRDNNFNGIIDANETLEASTLTGTRPETIDFSGLPAGRYFVQVSQWSGDTNYSLSMTHDTAGSTLFAARDLGTLNGNLTLNDFVGNSDPSDFYTFQTTTTSDFQLSLTGLSADADVYLIQDSNFNGIVDANDFVVFSALSGTTSETIDVFGLDAGRYFVEVSQWSGNTNYTLSMTTDAAGNTLAAARNLGTLNGSLTLNDFVGTGDPSDFYTFRTTSTTDFRLSLTGLTADADVDLIQDSNLNGIIDANDILVSSTEAGADSEIINVSGLDAGRYFVRVSQYSGNTNYALNLTATTSDIGNSYATAANIGTLNGQRRFTGSLGPTDPGDVYGFSINATSNLQLDLTGLTADADLFLVQDVNLNGVYDSADLLAFSTRIGTAAEQINRNNLAAGNYFAWIVPFGGPTSYTLTLATDAAGDTLDNARDIGILNGPRSYRDFVGNDDTRDFYRFQVASPTAVSLSLTGLTADADLSLIRDVNGNGMVDSADIVAFSVNASTAAESLTANLDTGTYFVQVNQFVPAAATPQTPTDTNYVLRLDPVS